MLNQETMSQRAYSPLTSPPAALSLRYLHTMMIDFRTFCATFERFDIPLSER